MSKRAVEQDHRRPTRLTLMKSNISDDLGNIFSANNNLHRMVHQLADAEIGASVACGLSGCCPALLRLWPILSLSSLSDLPQASEKMNATRLRGFPCLSGDDREGSS
jgi:hypothetical protein